MSNKKNNNFFIDDDMPFVLPTHEEYDLSALIDDYHPQTTHPAPLIPDISVEFTPDLSQYIDEVQTGKPLAK